MRCYIRFRGTIDMSQDDGREIDVQLKEWTGEGLRGVKANWSIHIRVQALTAEFMLFRVEPKAELTTERGEAGHGA